MIKRIRNQVVLLRSCTLHKKLTPATNLYTSNQFHITRKFESRYFSSPITNMRLLHCYILITLAIIIIIITITIIIITITIIIIIINLYCFLSSVYLLSRRYSTFEIDY